MNGIKTYGIKILAIAAAVGGGAAATSCLEDDVNTILVDPSDPAQGGNSGGHPGGDKPGKPVSHDLRFYMAGLRHPDSGEWPRLTGSGAEQNAWVEIDGESVDYLREEFPALSDDHIIAKDFLTLDLGSLYPGREFCVIGNYPYNISSQIFFHILKWKDQCVCCSGMLQKEVAERIAAKEGTKARGILSVLLQAWYDVEYLFTVDEHVFNPPPKVKSGVIRLTRNAVTELGCDPARFKTVVKTTFGQRRKTIRNSAKSLLPPGGAMPESPLMALRPEQLSVAQFVELTNLLS